MAGALGPFAQVCLELRERLLDRVEVRAVRREVEEASAGGLDHLAYRGRLVAQRVVHDHDVAGAEFRHEHLADIGVEGVTGDRAVEHHRRHHAGPAQAGHERGGLPMSMRHAGTEPLPTSAAAIATSRVGGCLGLVDEDQALGIEVELPLEPCPAPLYDVGAVLLARARLFLRVIW